MMRRAEADGNIKALRDEVTHVILSGNLDGDSGILLEKTIHVRT